MIALAVASAVGGIWLERFQVKQGRVLFIDNECHPETFAERLRHVCSALGVAPLQYADSIDVLILRGNLRDIDQLDPFLRSIEPGYYGLIIIDAGMYRTFAPMTENDNSAAVRPIFQHHRRAPPFDCWLPRSCLCIIPQRSNTSDRSTLDLGAGGTAHNLAADLIMAMRLA